MKNIIIALFLLIAGTAHAQGWGTQAPGCSLSGCTLTGPLVLNSTLNGWTPTLGVNDSSNASPAVAGTTYAVGDSLTLNDGCTTHATLGVVAISGSGISQFNVTNHGSCSVAPSNPVSVLSTSGTGTGATFTLTWAPMAAGINFGTLTNNGGNVFLSSEGPAPGYSGLESLIAGDKSMSTTVAGSFDVALGHNTLGNGTACPVLVTHNAVTATGTDAGRNSCGLARATLNGNGAMKNYTGSNVGGQAGFGITALGGSSMLNWNSTGGGRTAGQAGTTFPWDTAVGDGSCQGVAGATFTNGTCVGSNTGKALSSAQNFLILAGGGNGNVGSTTFASGNGVILIGSGKTVVDTPAAGTNDYINIDNVLTVTNTNAPTTTSVVTLRGATLNFPDMISSSAAQTGTVCWGTGGQLTYDPTLGCLTSSARFKRDIVDLDAGLAEVMRMRPVSFVYTNNPADKARQVGLIAEEVNAVDPRLVGYEPDGITPRGVRYAEYTAMLTKAIQQQQAQIDALKATIH